MCGIYGEITLSGDPGEGFARHAEASLDLLTHRGPDDRGTWVGSGVFLGIRRLSIIDLAGGHQPIWNEDGTKCIVFNGELYNFTDLRPQLEASGHIFRTRTDTEVVLHAYEEWGTDCLHRFNGMFAFAIWDESRRSLFLTRDRIGEKPLYYYVDGGRLVFGSEIKAILGDPSIPRELNLRGLANFLAFGHSVAPETAFQSVLKLLPGHYLLAEGGRVHVARYWDVGDEPELGPGETEEDEVELAARILELLDDSVRRRLVADVPVGAFLSGGLDSSAVAALMARHTGDRPKTFSLGFTVGGAYNELGDARRVAMYLGTDHHELEVHHADLVEILRTLVYHYDEPFADPAGFPVYLLSRFAREHVKVILTGDGGDELFGGYRRYAADQMAGLYQRLPRNLISSIPGVLDRLPRLRRLKQAAQALPIRDPGRRYATWLTLFSPEMQSELLSSDLVGQLRDHDAAALYPAHYARLNGGAAGDHLNRLMYVDLKTWLADAYMEKTDKATMACSLEARLPLLDHRLVELAFQIPARHKIRGLSTKRIFKRAVAPLVPPAVLRKPKHGFSVPLDPWFRGDLRSFAFEVLLDPSTRQRGYFDPSVVERLWREQVDGRQVWDSHLWLLMNFELWHRIFLDREPV
jgi:asparagine synthase (glutamine-hydrolysing)